MAVVRLATSVGGVGQDLSRLAEADDGGEQGIVGGQAVAVQAFDVFVDSGHVLGQALAFGLQAVGGVEGPDDQGAFLFEFAEDLDGDSVDRAFGLADVFSACASDRHAIAQPGGLGQGEAVIERQLGSVERGRARAVGGVSGAAPGC